MVGEVSESGGKLRAFSIGTPHDTGVREIRELISSGKAFAVLTPISLIPQIARGCSKEDMDDCGKSGPDDKDSHGGNSGCMVDSSSWIDKKT